MVSVLRECLGALLERILEKEEERKKLREKQETELERLWIMVSELRKDHELQMKLLRAELQRQPAPFDEVKNCFLCLEVLVNFFKGWCLLCLSDFSRLCAMYVHLKLYCH